jgi:hypothetical protein
MNQFRRYSSVPNNIIGHLSDKLTKIPPTIVKSIINVANNISKMCPSWWNPPTIFPISYESNMIFNIDDENLYRIPR